MRKHAANKRIIWLSCSAQSGLASVTRFSQMQVTVKIFVGGVGETGEVNEG